MDDAFPQSSKSVREPATQSSTADHRLIYRPEIDGLRAIAVLSVFIFHLNRRWLSGGFVGVDIFFVISGYLITSILYSDCQAGQFSLARFYQRRIARLFPAFFTVALGTIAGAAVVYMPQDFASAGANLVAASLSVANMKYIVQGDYFEISRDAQPFLHYWSLSVEEQFYLVFPLLLFSVFRYSRPRLPHVLGLVGMGSLIACVALTKGHAVWAFYLLPTRAWELAAGAFLATGPFARGEVRRSFAPRWLPIAGLLTIGLSFALIQEGPTFPGWRAVFPVAGAAAIILPGANSYGWVQTWLSTRPMVSLGRCSYSLYLWHWPIFSLIDYQLYLSSDETRLVLKVGLSALLTLITFRFIEAPGRLFLSQPERRHTAFAVLTGAVFLSVSLGVAIRRHNYIDASVADLVQGGLAFPGEQGAASVVLMGDSNGSMYGKVMKEICSELGASLTVISVSAGDPLPQRTGDPGSERLWAASLNVVRKTRPDYLVLGVLWSEKLQGDRERLTLAIERLKPYVGHLILLNQPPVLPKDVNRAAYRAGLRPPFFEPKDDRARRRLANEFLLSFGSPDVVVIDISSYFEKAEGEILFADNDGRQLYQDATHLSGYGVERVRDALRQAVSGRRSAQ